VASARIHSTAHELGIPTSATMMYGQVVLLPFIHETISQLRAITDPLGRLLRRRTTTYGEPSEERPATAAGSGGVTSAVRNRLPLVTS
jgi:hypothetical protein